MHEKHIDQLSLFPKRSDHNAKQDWNYGNKEHVKETKDSLFVEDILMHHLAMTVLKHHYKDTELDQKACVKSEC